MFVLIESLQTNSILNDILNEFYYLNNGFLYKI